MSRPVIIVRGDVAEVVGVTERRDDIFGQVEAVDGAWTRVRTPDRFLHLPAGDRAVMVATRCAAGARVGEHVRIVTTIGGTLAVTQILGRPVVAAEPPASWVIREKVTGAVLFETFSADVVAKLNTKRYEAVPILEHLQGINRRQS